MNIPDRIKDNVRAVLLSKTDGSGVLVSNFAKDYKSILHEQLMYRDLGYQTLQDFIKALPEVCRLEFSEKDMAYKLYGIAKPNTFVSSFVKRAEGVETGQPSRGRRGKGGSGDDGSKGECLDLGTALDEEWIPNCRGHFTVCFPNRHENGLETREAVELLFAKAGDVKDVNIIESLTFVRYRSQTHAKTALRIWGESLGLKRAEEKPGRNRKEKAAGSGKESGSYRKNSGQESSFRNPMNKSETLQKSPVITNKPVEMPKSPVNKSEPVSRNTSFSLSGETDSKPNVDSKSQKTDTAADDQLFQVYIGNWPIEANESVLEEMLEGYNYVNFRLMRKKGHAQKTFAFVRFTSMKEGQRLIDEMNGQMFMNRDLKVRLGIKEPYTVSPNTEETNKNRRKGSDIESEFKRFNVHNGRGSNTDTISPLSRTVTNNIVKNHSPSIRPGNSFPTEMPPLEKAMPDLEGMPDLEPISVPTEMPSLIPNLGNNGIKNGFDDMPQLEGIPLPSPAQSYTSSIPSVETVQLFIGNFPYGTKEWELTQLLEQYGGHSLRMMNKNTLNRSTYAFISFDDYQQAQMAILNLDQHIFKGRALTVAMASPEHCGGALSPDLILNGGPLANITCTVGENNQRVINVEDAEDGFSQCSRISSVNGSAIGPSGDKSSHIICKRDDSFNYRKFTCLLRDYSLIVTKLRGDDEFQYQRGQKLKILVTHAENEKFFWGQDVKGESSYLKQLQKIMVGLQSEEKTRGVKNKGRCMAPYQGEWYRAWVTHIKEKDDVLLGEVLFLDYGNKVVLPMAQIFLTRPQVWNIPPLAKPFKMSEIVCQLQSLENSVIVVTVNEPASFHANFLTLVTIDQS